MKVETFLSDRGCCQDVGPERRVERAADFLRARRWRFIDIMVLSMRLCLGAPKRHRSVTTDTNFVLLLRPLEPEGADVRCERRRQILNQPIRVDLGFAQPKMFVEDGLQAAINARILIGVVSENGK